MPQLPRHEPQVSYYSQAHETQSIQAFLPAADEPGLPFQTGSGEEQTASHLPPGAAFQPHYPFSAHDAAQETLEDVEFSAYPVEGTQSDELASYPFQVIEQCTSHTEHPTDEVPLQDGVSSWDAGVEGKLWLSGHLLDGLASDLADQWSLFVDTSSSWLLPYTSDVLTSGVL